MESGLTYEEIVEILLRQDELLGLYRNQLKELTKEYDADDELIELTQLRSPRLGVTGGGGNQKGLDQICQAVEQQRKAYREAVYEEMQRVLAAYNRVQKVHRKENVQGIGRPRTFGNNHSSPAETSIKKHTGLV